MYVNLHFSHGSIFSVIDRVYNWRVFGGGICEIFPLKSFFPDSVLCDLCSAFSNEFLAVHNSGYSCNYIYPSLTIISWVIKYSIFISNFLAQGGTLLINFYRVRPFPFPPAHPNWSSHSFWFCNPYLIEILFCD